VTAAIHRTKKSFTRRAQGSRKGKIKIDIVKKDKYCFIMTNNISPLFNKIVFPFIKIAQTALPLIILSSADSNTPTSAVIGLASIYYAGMTYMNAVYRKGIINGGNDIDFRAPSIKEFGAELNPIKGLKLPKLLTPK
jgi:hypothetical protein